MYKRSYFTVLLATLLIGCSTSQHRYKPSRFAQLSIGMAKPEVTQLLGAPSQTATGRIYLAPNSSVNSGFSELWRYRWTSRRETNDHIVVFVKEKVTEYGPLTGDLATRYGGSFH